MSNVVANGLMSYALRVDKNIRFCASNPAGDECGNGFVDPTGITTPANVVQQHTTNLFNELAKDPPKISVEYLDQELKVLGAGLTRKDEADVSRLLQNNDIAAVEDIVISRLSTASRQQQTDTESHPFNTIEANKTYSERNLEPESCSPGDYNCGVTWRERVRERERGRERERETERERARERESVVCCGCGGAWW